MSDLAKAEMVTDAICDARNSLRGMRREAADLVEELRVADCFPDDLQMIRESVKILERMADLVARMSGEGKCVEYLHNTLRSNS